MDMPATVLLIDDEASFVRGLAGLLRRDGFRVDTAADGLCALAYLRAQRSDVILCDLVMPVLDGPAFYAILRQRDRALSQRVIFVTGDTWDVASTAFLAQCGQPWLAKPCTGTEVRCAIHHLLARATSPVPLRPVREASPRGSALPETGTLCILAEPPGYRARYASNNVQRPERQPVTCPDAAALTAVLHACGLDAWARQRACAELQEGRVAILPLVCTPTQLDATFPVAPPNTPRAVSRSQRLTPHEAIHACLFPHGTH